MALLAEDPLRFGLFAQQNFNLIRPQIKIRENAEISTSSFVLVFEAGATAQNYFDAFGAESPVEIRGVPPPLTFVSPVFGNLFCGLVQPIFMGYFPYIIYAALHQQNAPFRQQTAIKGQFNKDLKHLYSGS
jgi:hypothetical protein